MLPYKLLFLFTLLSSVFCGTLYNYGTDAGDQAVSHSDQPSAVRLRIPVKFENEVRNDLYLYPNGIVTFDSQLPSDYVNLYEEPHNAIAPFYIPTTDGTLYYRATTDDQKLLRNLSKLIKRQFPHDRDFKALYAVVITWDGLANEKAGADKKNKFQLVVMTDEQSSYAMLLYENIDWTEIDDEYAVAGLYSATGTRLELPTSGRAESSELPRYGNYETEKGHFLYRLTDTFGEPKTGDNDESNEDAEDAEDEAPEGENVPSPPEPHDIIPDEPVEPHPAEPEPEYPHRPDVDEEASPEPPEPEAIPEYPGPQQPEHVPEYTPRPEHVPEHPVPPQPEPVPERPEYPERPEHPERPERPGHPYPPYRPPEPRLTTHAPPRQPEPQPPRIGEGAWYPGSGQRVPDGYNLPLTCAAASAAKSPCDTHARCVDYHPGFCCECEEGYYGNGEECIKKGTNERVYGTFEGMINGVELKNNTLHTFANTEKGQAYIALTGLDSHLGKSLLLADEIASVIGWLYAKIDSPGAYNGFQLTGGIFNRTVNIHIGDRHALMVKQHFTGRDVHDYFQVQMYITGTIPHVDERSPVVYPPRDVEYRREGPGFVRSHAFYNVIIKEQGFERPVRISVDQQIYYKECPYKRFDKEPVVVVKVSRSHVVYDGEEKNVRYAAENKAMNGFQGYRPGDRYRFPPPPQTQEERPQSREQPHRPEQPPAMPTYPPVVQQPHPTQPRPHQQQQGQDVEGLCAPGRHVCTLPNMHCTVEGGRSGCRCDSGYVTKIDSAAEPLGWRCEDLDECRSRYHNCSPNAACHNTIGGFQCTCNPGFVGDGHTCQRIGAEARPEDRRPAGPGCRSHGDCHMYGECVFGQHGQPNYCKCRGHYVGDGVNHCGPAATPPPQPPRHGGQEHDSRRCGHYICHEHGVCISSPTGTQNCRCKEGYIGNGVFCERKDPMVATVPVGAVCTSHQNCGEHAACVHQSGFYRCVCVPPHVPDGGRCVLDRRPAPTRGPTPCNIANNCDRNADCMREGSFYRCICRPGFTGNGYTCTSQAAPPAAELQCDRLHNCGANAVCEYEEQRRRHVCRCMSGFGGDGYSCVPLPTAPSVHDVQSHVHHLPPTPQPTHRPAEKRCRQKNECHQFAHCVPSSHSGEHVCECLNGFKGDGIRECRPVEECNPARADECHPNAECVYSQQEGAFKCKCRDGFAGDGIRACSKEHLPCNRDPSVCAENAQCVYSNNDGAYVCACKQGWNGDPYRNCEITQNQICAQCSSNARCVQTEEGYQCRCNPGFQGNGRVCTTTTSCLRDHSICDENAQCIPDQQGVYVCNCKYGYHGNGRVCTPDRTTGDVLLISRGMSVVQRGIEPSSLGKQILIKNDHLMVGLAYDCKEQRIYWSNVRGTINSAFLNGTSDKVILNTSGTEGIAVDYASRNLYYVDANASVIGVVSLNGNYRKTLAKEGITQPRFITLDLNSRQLYYSDWNRSHPRIGRMNLDGTEHGTFIDTDLKVPNGLVVVPQRRELCWVDSEKHALSCIGLDGRNRRVVKVGLESPFGLTVYGDQLYWTDWKDMKLHTVALDGHGYATLNITAGLTKPYGITVAPSSCRTVSTPCSVDNGGCPYLCLPSQSQAKCVCPENNEALDCVNDS